MFRTNSLLGAQALLAFRVEKFERSPNKHLGPLEIFRAENGKPQFLRKGRSNCEQTRARFRSLWNYYAV